MAHANSRQIGSAMRIYKNSAGTVIAIDNIAVVAETRKVSASKFHFSAHPTRKRTCLYLGVGTRVVASILVIGDFTTLTDDSGDHLTATWPAQNTGYNDVEISFLVVGARIGDTL